MSEKTELPRHVGFIVDGNRRWAKKHGLPAYEGHLAGYNSLKDVLLETLRRGVKYASAYVFSTENWKRSEEEVGHLMGLLLKVLESDVPIFLEHNVRMRVIGSREGLSETLRKAIERAEERTRNLTGGELLLCLNYGGHLEIADAVKKIVQSGVTAEDVTPELIAQNLYAPEVPPCDLIVRTSGEQRLSNFMLWRAAYSELMFIEKNWPDMTIKDVEFILEEYKKRNRRFGG
ncbi:di-trans,poly-cis-decaprenylcistransferase [Candidatus Saccharibacteria bacterium oral taxon 488]|nr:di-trans,poly-cis-decaprenylcistransferase [Candidatus Saccharibacteria bacterium oral taxon 488]